MNTFLILSIIHRCCLFAMARPASITRQRFRFEEEAILRTQERLLAWSACLARCAEFLYPVSMLKTSTQHRDDVSFIAGVSPTCYRMFVHRSSKPDSGSCRHLEGPRSKCDGIGSQNQL